MRDFELDPFIRAYALCARPILVCHESYLCYSLFIRCVTPFASGSRPRSKALHRNGSGSTGGFNGSRSVHTSINLAVVHVALWHANLYMSINFWNTLVVCKQVVLEESTRWPSAKLHGFEKLSPSCLEVQHHLFMVPSRLKGGNSKLVILPSLVNWVSYEHDQKYHLMINPRWHICSGTHLPIQFKPPSDPSCSVPEDDKVLASLAMQLLPLGSALPSSASRAPNAKLPAAAAATAARHAGFLGMFAAVFEMYLKVLDGGLRAAHIPHSTGLSIVLLTLTVKLLTWPLSERQARATHAMQSLQPKVRALKERLRGNPAALQAQTAALYKAEGINPLTSILSSLVTIPVFIGLYRALGNVAQDGLLSDGFLWIPSLSGPQVRLDNEAQPFAFICTELP